ncbi:hypothetical protein [Geothrix sp. PMB-07]|uniref:hypothetical protein n=1 Tax=Geothrix sp. PMB-07 TaxID=3068640 RepID=UPI0027417201|nr:hypothetical protein [Geothrix sp. PMB-07]WLT32578.1 hypothetical protein Q9293_04425 [Geothrix sp. PMB-07]
MSSRSVLLSVSCLALLLVACGGGGSTVSTTPAAPPPVATPTVNAYSGTASVGDFLQITLDATAHTIQYKNLSNGDSGTVSYATNADGTYAITDPTGNLQTAYEVPGYALIIKANKTGADHATPSLITAIQTQPITRVSISNRSYNYMQFRTNSGGVEVGSLKINSSGDVAIESFWPYGEQSGSGAFHTGSPVTGSAILTDPSGSFLKVPDDGGKFDYIFGTTGGFFAVDTPNGGIVSLNKAATKDFLASYAGSYKSIAYRKVGAHTGMGNVETSTTPGWLWSATIDISATGLVQISDGSAPFITAQLIPLADAAYLQGAGKLADPCNGLFTLRYTTTANGITYQRDVFVTFLDHSLLFSSFKTALPMNGGNDYEYCYGVGLK